MKVIFLHHAGGDQYAYKKFKPLLETIGWEGVFYDLPGHGDRFGEDLQDEIHAIAAEAYQKLLPHFEGEYAIFGTSMGTLIAYLICHQLENDNKKLPVHLFLASRRCPDSHLRFPPVADLPEDEFWTLVSKYGGCPPALVKNKELREVYEPMLRSDFRALENYRPIKRKPLDIPATILLGEKDNITYDQMKNWQQHFQPNITILTFQGGHFFCYILAEEMVAVMRDKLNK